MSRIKMKDVLLDRPWSGHKAGEIVTVEDFTAKSMVRKEYGSIISPSEKKKIESARQPKVERADAPPQAKTEVPSPPVEKAVSTPDPSAKTKEKPPEKGGAD